MDRVIAWFKQWRLVSWRSAALAAVMIYGLVGFIVVPVIAKRIIVETVRERTGREVTVWSAAAAPPRPSVAGAPALRGRRTQRP